MENGAASSWAGNSDIELGAVTWCWEQRYGAESRDIGLGTVTCSWKQYHGARSMGLDAVPWSKDQ